MGRGSGLCARCGGNRNGGSARRSIPVEYCSQCHAPVCKRHVRWTGDAWRCTKCEREAP